jgi:hypothetical protein
MNKQIITVAIACNQNCPKEMPDTCTECPLINGANIKVIEVLADKRNQDELPPAMDKIGNPIQTTEENGQSNPM